MATPPPRKKNAPPLLPSQNPMGRVFSGVFSVLNYELIACKLSYICFIRFHFRRHYIKKCEQFFKLKTEQDVEQVGFVLTTPSTAAIVIIFHLVNHCIIFSRVADYEIP